MQARPIRKAVLASGVGVSVLLLIGGCAEYIKPSPYAVFLKEVAPSDVAQGCPPIESEWWAATNARGKLRNKPHPGIDIHLPRGTPILASAPEFEGGRLSLLQFAAYSDLIVNPRFLWYPYVSGNTPPAAGRAQRYDPSRTYGDRPGLFTGLTYPVRCT